MVAYKPKHTKGRAVAQKQVELPPKSTDSCKQVWVFDSIDRDGHFSFIPSKANMDCENILSNIIEYSSRTWIDIKKETHDKGKSKHHFLNPDALSEEAKRRVYALKLEDKIEDIFSMRMNNKVRIIGIRDGQNFIVKWFDPNHEFAPSNR